VDLYIHYLRRKMDEIGAPKLIKTVRGVGYRLAARPDQRKSVAAKEP
jgi:DNA-binding response OmpR family regulator